MEMFEKVWINPSIGHPNIKLDQASVSIRIPSKLWHYLGIEPIRMRQMEFPSREHPGEHEVVINIGIIDNKDLVKLYVALKEYLEVEGEI